MTLPVLVDQTKPGLLKSWSTRRHSVADFTLLRAHTTGFIRAITATATLDADFWKFYAVNEAPTPVRPYWTCFFEIRREREVLREVDGVPVNFRTETLAIATSAMQYAQSFPGRGIPFWDGLQVAHLGANGSLSILVEIIDGDPVFQVDPEI